MQLRRPSVSPARYGKAYQKALDQLARERAIFRATPVAAPSKTIRRA
jgi:hypothetical protein